MNSLVSLPTARGIAAFWVACSALAGSLVHAAGTLTVTGTLTPQGSSNYCIYSAMSDDAQGNWQVTCGGTGSRTITFATPLVGQVCTSFSSLTEDSGGNWTVLNCVSSGTPANIYYVHTDNLGTARLVTRPSDDAVTWRWDNTEPFGVGSANDTMSGTQFSYNLRFPGQYYDQETVTHYNYYRDYEPSVGRYVESDPIGLKGGLNSYAYVSSRPLAIKDVLGLKAQMCCKKIPWLPAAHCFINEEQEKEKPCAHCPSKTRRVGLQGPSPWGSSSYQDAGEIRVNDNFDQPGQSRCGSWNATCTVSQCIDRVMQQYPNPSQYDAISGPNSNTFATFLAKECGIPLAEGPWPTPGWGQPPAGPAAE